jgi:ABC-type phosphate transport system substrate-binding protein
MVKFNFLIRNVFFAERETLFRYGLVLLVFFVVFITGQSFAEEKREVIAGAGPSTRIVVEFVKYLSKHEAAQGYSFIVPKKSAKHAGGIKNTDKYVFGRTGRPLNEMEKSVGMEEIFLSKMPIAFVTGAESGIRTLSLDQICGIFTGRYRNWRDVGGNDRKIIVFTREPTEALFQTLKKDIPCMNNVVDTKYILKKDDHIIEMFKTTDTGRIAIGFGAASNFPERAIITVDGFNSGVNLGLVYKSANRDHPLVRAAKEVAHSEEWRAATKALGVGWPY